MNKRITGNVTQKKLDAWLAQYRPHLDTYDTGSYKGIYNKRAGVAHSFEKRGKTWREVAESLGAV
jgi:hypothetical protein